MYFDFANVLVFFGLSLVFVAAMLVVGSFVRPYNPEPAKLSTYECGELPTGSAWMNFNIRFYLVALIFVIFDVEIAFVMPVATVFREWVLDGRALYAIVELGLFLAVLFVGLVVVWSKGDLEWLKKVPANPEPGTSVETTPVVRDAA